jgi:hypothetical protein
MSGWQGLCDLPRDAENRLIPWPSLFSPFDQSGKLQIVEWKLWVLKNKKALLEVQIFLKARGAKKGSGKKCLSYSYLLCIQYNVLGGKADKGENHTLFLLRTFSTVEIFRSVSSSLWADFNFFCCGTPLLTNIQWLPSPYPHYSKRLSAI